MEVATYPAGEVLIGQFPRDTERSNAPEYFVVQIKDDLKELSE